MEWIGYSTQWRQVVRPRREKSGGRPVPWNRTNQRPLCILSFRMKNNRNQYIDNIYSLNMSEFVVGSRLIAVKRVIFSAFPQLAGSETQSFPQ